MATPVRARAFRHPLSKFNGIPTRNSNSRCAFFVVGDWHLGRLQWPIRTTESVLESRTDSCDSFELSVVLVSILVSCFKFQRNSNSQSFVGRRRCPSPSAPRGVEIPLEIPFNLERKRAYTGLGKSRPVRPSYPDARGAPVGCLERDSLLRPDPRTGDEDSHRDLEVSSQCVTNETRTNR